MRLGMVKKVQNAIDGFFKDSAAIQTRQKYARSFLGEITNLEPKQRLPLWLHVFLLFQC